MRIHNSHRIKYANFHKLWNNFKEFASWSTKNYILRTNKRDQKQERHRGFFWGHLILTFTLKGLISAWMAFNLSLIVDKTLKYINRIIWKGAFKVVIFLVGTYYFTMSRQVCVLKNFPKRAQVKWCEEIRFFLLHFRGKHFIECIQGYGFVCTFTQN